MDRELLLISHSVCKKRTAAEAQLTPISPTGEFVTTYYTPPTKTKASKRQKFRYKLLKCFSRSDVAVSAYCDIDWAAQLSGNVGNNRVPEKNILGCNEYIESTTANTGNCDSREENLACSFDKLHDFRNPFHLNSVGTGNNKIYASKSEPVFGDQGAFVAHSVNRSLVNSSTSVGREDQKPSRKHRFRTWLNDKRPRSSYGEVNLILKDVFAVIAEEVAKFAFIREKSRVIAKSGAITTAAYARVNAATVRTSISHDTAVEVIRQACQDVLSVSLMPRWKNIDYIRLCSICHYELNLIEPRFGESMRRSILKNGVENLTVEGETGEELYKNEPEPIQPVQFFRFEESIEKKSDLSAFDSENASPSEVFEEHFESNCPEGGDHAPSTTTKKWMSLLVSRIDLFGKARDIVRVFGDKIDNKLIEIDGTNSLKNAPLELELAIADDLNNGFNPCMLDSSWIHVLLPHIEYGPSPPNEISAGMGALEATEDPIASPGFSLHFDKSSGCGNSTLESNLKVTTKKTAEDLEGGIDDSSTLENLAFKEATSPKVTSFSGCDDYATGLSKAYMRMEVLNSRFEQISSQVDRIVCGTTRNVIVNELPLESCQDTCIVAEGSHHAPVPSKDDYKISNNSKEILDSCNTQHRVEDLSPVFTTFPEMQIKELFSQIDDMLRTFDMIGNREVYSATRENNLYLELDTEQTIPQIDELLSLIDIAIMATAIEGSVLSTRSVPDFTLRDTTTGKRLIAERDCRLSGVDFNNSLVTKFENPMGSLFSQDRKQGSTGPWTQVNALLAQIDSVITNIDSGD
ncbi:hypothetical protein ZYGR_0AL01870 [Zygosaccharomyces rouxii]|uniref:Uncharacterized protein n=1 Tax=Zygosaccharomyces rouxii TaxID=4956 RepID=A0A1Q3AFQ0_ZYGRO|nr:hypothetical protein ZYGR_0AL01870 [Zygosaccharomyces rouxii]